MLLVLLTAQKLTVVISTKSLQYLPSNWNARYSFSIACRAHASSNSCQVSGGRHIVFLALQYVATTPLDFVSILM